MAANNLCVFVFGVVWSFVSMDSHGGSSGDGGVRPHLPQASAPPLSGVMGDAAPAAEEEEEITLSSVNHRLNHVQYDLVAELQEMLQTHSMRLTSLEQSAHVFPGSLKARKMQRPDVEMGNALHAHIRHRSANEGPWRDAATQYGEDVRVPDLQ